MALLGLGSGAGKVRWGLFSRTSKFRRMVGAAIPAIRFGTVSALFPISGNVFGDEESVMHITVRALEPLKIVISLREHDGN